MCDECHTFYVRNGNQKFLHTFCGSQCSSKHKSKVPSKRRISLDETRQRIYKVHGDTITVDEKSYVSISKRCFFIHKIHGKWPAQPGNITAGCSHPKTKIEKLKKSLTKTVTIDELQDKLFIVHNDVVTLVEDQQYTGCRTKMSFKDKDFGIWEANLDNVLGGHGHPIRGQLLSQSKQHYSSRTNHWKTNEELICSCSYEKAFVEWCNNNQIDFDWQVPHKMPDGKRYYIDAYIKTGKFTNTWIEIKGTFNRKNGHIGKAKWEWFHSVHPNDSQIWFKEQLIEHGILENNTQHPDK